MNCKPKLPNFLLINRISNVTIRLTLTFPNVSICVYSCKHQFKIITLAELFSLDLALMVIYTSRSRAFKNRNNRSIENAASLPFIRLDTFG